MGALFSSRSHGIGQQVDVSAQEALAGNVDNRILFYAYSGEKTTRDRWPGGIPQGAYPCEDGYVVFGVGYDLYFRRLCDAMDRSDIYQDARFATYDARSANAEEFEAIFIGWLMEHTKYEVFEKCQAHRVMCAPLLSFEELMDDPQLKARGFFSRSDHPATGPLPATGAPFIMTATPWQTLRPAPLLGEHNTEVFGQELGYSLEELARLRTHGVI
jgi:crotonobetainyl-CoA:carnitine CoA-transferase CaiB-like acyl-CoA transferase